MSLVELKHLDLIKCMSNLITTIEAVRMLHVIDVHCYTKVSDGVAILLIPM